MWARTQNTTSKPSFFLFVIVHVSWPLFSFFLFLRSVHTLASLSHTPPTPRQKAASPTPSPRRGKEKGGRGTGIFFVCLRARCSITPLYWYLDKKVGSGKAVHWSRLSPLLLLLFLRDHTKGALSPSVPIMFHVLSSSSRLASGRALLGAGWRGAAGRRLGALGGGGTVRLEGG